jgi:hypothetical protein
MALDFPANPIDGEVFGSYVWSGPKGVWQSREESASPAVVSSVPPTSSNPGDIWVDSSDGVSYVRYDDGSSAQWIELISSGVPSLAGKADIDHTHNASLDITSGELSVQRGGTGQTFLTSGGYLKGAGSLAITSQTGIPAGDVTSGTLSSARLPSGTVLQVVESFRTSSVTVSGQYSYGDTGLSVTITPRSSSSRFRLTGNLIASCSGAGWVFMRFVRNSTVIGNGSIGSSVNHNAVTYIEDFGRIEPINGVIIDSPNTTSAITYKIQFATFTGTAILNRRSADTLFCGYSNLIVEEIA